MYGDFIFVHTNVCYIFVKRKFEPSNEYFCRHKKYYMNLTQEEWAEQLAQDQNAVVLDVRTDDEWEDGIIPNAVLLDIYKGQEFIDGIEALDKSKNYYVYCKAGGRSQQACHIMNQVGIATAYNLIGGIMQWKGEIVPYK